MDWIEVNFSCSKHRDWHWFFNKGFGEYSVVTKESRGANCGGEGAYLRMSRSLFPLFVYRSGCIRYTFKRSMLTSLLQAFYRVGDELWRELESGFWRILSECLLLQIKEVLKNKGVCLVHITGFSGGWKVSGYNLNRALAPFCCISLCSVCPQCWLPLQGAFLHGNAVVVLVQASCLHITPSLGEI